MKSRFLTVRDDCLTEARSKAEIKASALRRSDETQSCYPHQNEKESFGSPFSFFRFFPPLWHEFLP